MVQPAARNRSRSGRSNCGAIQRMNPKSGNRFSDEIMRKT
jgi:hypothetical protein